MNFLKLRSGLSVLEYEINAFKTEAIANKYIYLLAGVHGDEVEGIYALKQLFNELQQNNKSELPIVVIPLLNIDGHQNGTRVNAHGVDLNRNCPSSSWSNHFSDKKYNPGSGPNSEPENKFLFKLMDKFRPGIILSLHSWRPLINYNGDCHDVAMAISQKNQYPIAADIGYPTPGSLGDFAPEKYLCPVITFEFPLFNNEFSLASIWQHNKSSLLSLFTGSTLNRFL